MVIKKLFPKKKNGNKVETVARLKTTIHHLNIKTREFNRKSKEARLRAMKSLQSGNREIARQMLIQEKTYKAKTQKYYNMIGKMERHLEALEEANVIKDVTETFESSSKELGTIAKDINPTSVTELVDGADESISQIEEAGEIMAGDLELDSGYDVENELNQLESELLMADASGMPSIPDDFEDSELSLDEDEETEVKSKEKLKDEINRLKKELDM